MNSNGGGLHYISHKDIDYSKWDNCVGNSENSRVYAMSWYLDRTAEIWDALVFGNYDFVMPLPVRKKWGIKYVYQPVFTQQLGIFPTPSTEIAKLFYSKVASLFRYSDVQINSRNPVLASSNIDFNPRSNFLLSLDKKYNDIAKAYSKNTKQYVSKSAKNSLSYVKGVRMEDYLAFKKNNLKPRLSDEDLRKLKSIIAHGQYLGIAEIFGVYTASNELCAAAYFCRWNGRLIYMNAVSNDKGRKLAGMFFLIDRFIRSSAETGMILDFEGSMVPGIVRFISGFGSSPENYHQLKINRLPLPVKWLKRNLG